MANSDRPNGLAPVKHITGASWNEQVNRYVILAANTDAFYIGDAVKSFAGGDAEGVPALAKAAAGNVLRGVVVGVEVDGNNLESLTVPATKTRDYYVLVCDDPTVVFEVQANNAAAFPTADLNANANLVIAAPTGAVPFSASELDASTTDTTSTLQLKILGKVQRPGVDLTANTKLLVIINQHELMGGTTAVAA